MRPFRPHAFALLLALALVLGVTGLSAPSNAASGTTAAKVQARSFASSYDDLVLHFTNVQRRKHGLRALRPAGCLDRYASSWTRYMAANDSFRHQALRPILSRCRQHTAGENIARGRPVLGAAQVVNMWMHSPGHRANILNGRYRYLAVDAWRSTSTGYVYVTQDFAG